MAAVLEKKRPDKRHLIGLIGEAHFIEFASEQGWFLYRGLDGHTPCDFVVDTGKELLRVEVKRIESVQITDKNYYCCTLTKFDSDRFDYLFVSTPVSWYWIPASDVPKSTLSIKQKGEYLRIITKPGKYEEYCVK